MQESAIYASAVSNLPASDYQQDDSTWQNDSAVHDDSVVLNDSTVLDDSVVLDDSAYAEAAAPDLPAAYVPNDESAVDESLEAERHADSAHASSVPAAAVGIASGRGHESSPEADVQWSTTSSALSSSQIGSVMQSSHMQLPEASTDPPALSAYGAPALQSVSIAEQLADAYQLPAAASSTASLSATSHAQPAASQRPAAAPPLIVSAPQQLDAPALQLPPAPSAAIATAEQQVQSEVQAVLDHELAAAKSVSRQLPSLSDLQAADADGWEADSELLVLPDELQVPSRGHHLSLQVTDCLCMLVGVKAMHKAT